MMLARVAGFCLAAALALVSAVRGDDAAPARPSGGDCEPELPRGPDVVERRCGAAVDPGLADHLVARDLSLRARVPTGCALAISLRVAADEPAARLILGAERAEVDEGPALSVRGGEVTISLSGAHLELSEGEVGARARFAPVADRTGRIQVGTHGHCEDARLVFERIGS